MASDIDREALIASAKAVAKVDGSNMLEWTPAFESDVEFASYRTMCLTFAEAAILAYRSAMEAKLRPAEEVADECATMLGSLLGHKEDQWAIDYVLPIFTAAILKDRKERA